MDYDDITYFRYYGGIALFSALVERHGRQAGAQLGCLGLIGLAFCYRMMAMSPRNGTEIGIKSPLSNRVLITGRLAIRYESSGHPYCFRGAISCLKV